LLENEGDVTVVVYSSEISYATHVTQIRTLLR